MYIYVNGEYLRADQAKISPFDHGYLYGIGLFETLRLYNGHPFLLDDHFRRLQQSMFELNITYSLVKEDLLAIIDKLSQLNDLPNAYIRVNVSAGSAPIGLSSEVYTEPTVIVFMKELPQVVSRFRDAVILKTNRNTPEGQRRLKSHHYLNNMIAKRELGSRDKEGVFLTKEGYVAESIVSNIFWSKGKTVYTPSIETGILNGITRQFITSLLRKQGIHVKEGFFTEGDLLSAEEIFLTNSIQEIVSVKTLNNFTSNTFSLSDRLLEQYKRCIGVKMLSRYELENFGGI